MQNNRSDNGQHIEPIMRKTVSCTIVGSAIGIFVFHEVNHVDCTRKTYKFYSENPETFPDVE